MREQIIEKYLTKYVYNVKETSELCVTCDVPVPAFHRTAATSGVAPISKKIITCKGLPKQHFESHCGAIHRPRAPTEKYLDIDKKMLQRWMDG